MLHTLFVREHNAVCDMLHEAYPECDDDQLFNEMHIAQAPDKMMAVDAAPGASVQLKCDIHPWMETWVYVSDNSLFAVTGADGKFSIEGVPAGSYEIEVWHPHLGKKTATAG